MHVYSMFSMTRHCGFRYLLATLKDLTAGPQRDPEILQMVLPMTWGWQVLGYATCACADRAPIGKTCVLVTSCSFRAHGGFQNILDLHV